eukprot:TRINITY_DN2072_c0_g1_i15.p1 TRINITY_DN2072_c0_g1~~TRINITY_DN2072_c0_g1_i15.p1  ORF type:complete len:285 (+),score=48.48 TRINITY_DN2072_c0_g1_i15:139-993(+)
MFEARLAQAQILKKIIDSIKDLVDHANFDCSSTGISLQAMDSSHVSLVTLVLKADGFEHYRCDRNISLGIPIAELCKILKCAGNDDMITMKAKDSGEAVTFVFESPKQTRISHFDLKLMDIDSEHLGIPDTDYKCTVKMSSSAFQRICKEIAIIGDTVSISASKEGVKFTVNGESGTGSIHCKQDSSVDEEDSVVIKLEEKMSLTFALRYLNYFAKATPLSKYVSLKLSPDVPLVVEYQIGEEELEMGHLRFYLAPKIEEDEAGGVSAAKTEGGEGGGGEVEAE